MTRRKIHAHPGRVYLVPIHKWLFFTISASIGGIPCAVYYMHTSPQSLDFLELAKNASFLNWKLASA
jgi:hypothetical protein